MVATLCYSLQGSGFGFTRADVLDMEVGEALYYAEALDEQRRRESDAVRAAVRRKK